MQDQLKNVGPSNFFAIPPECEPEHIATEIVPLVEVKVVCLMS